MMYKHIFSVGIKAPQGSEISFEKTRQFIYWLKQSGFNIIGVSLDGFQSADSKQIFISNNYDASIISMDKTPQAYLTLRSAMNDKRIGLIKLDLLETELVQLQRDVQTGKIDHPRDGSKDIADSLAGALFNATLHKQSLMDNMQLLSVAADVNEEYDPRQEMLDNMSQSLLAQNKNSYSAAAKLEELLNGYGNDSNILAW